MPTYSDRMSIAPSNLRNALAIARSFSTHQYALQTIRVPAFIQLDLLNRALDPPQRPARAGVWTTDNPLDTPDAGAILPVQPSAGPRWRNWQTRQLEVLVGVKSLGGSSPLLGI